MSWSVLEPEVRALAAGARTPGDVYPAIRRLLAQLGDRHSSVMTPRAHATYVAGRFANPAPVVRVVGDTASDTAGDRVSNGVGVVTLPPYLGNVPDSVGAYVERLHRALVAAAPHARCGWVVDLRRDRGGNMTPMLGALRPFLGDGTLGTMVPPGPDPGTPWNARRVPVAPPHALAPLEIAYVAVLTGRGTARAGEAVVVSFRGRPRTRTFGQATAGLTSGTRGFPLPDGGALVLATVAFADRTGRRYDGGIAPDELVNPTTRGPAGRDDDAPLTRARAWLAGASGCGAAP